MRGAGAVLLGLLLSACGGSAPAASPAASAASPSSAAAVASAAKPAASTAAAASAAKPAASAAALRKTKLAYAAQSPTLIVQILARDAGIFQKHNIDAETSYVGGGAILPALIGGDIQFAELSDPMVVSGVLEGAPIEWVAINVHTPTLQLVVQPEIASVADLKGKTIGVTNLGAVTALFAQLALTQNGLDPKKDVNLLATGGIPATLAALSNKRIDGAMFSALDGRQAVNQGGRVLVDFAKNGYTFPFGGLAVRKDFATSNPGVVSDVVAAFIEATDLFKKDRAAAEKVIAAALSLSDPAVLHEGYDAAAAILDTNVAPMPKEIQTVLDMLAPNNPKAKDAKPEQFFDDRFVRRS